jgi:hypothetical protein
VREQEKKERSVLFLAINFIFGQKNNILTCAQTYEEGKFTERGNANFERENSLKEGKFR